MKLKITYQPEEQEQAAKVLAALSGLLPGVRVHKNASKAPFIHLYLTTKKPGDPCNFKQNA